MARLFVCKRIVKQIEAGVEAIEKNINLLDESSMKAQYIYIYALFESTLTETIRYYLTAFPEKINKSITVSKELLLSSSLTSVVVLDVINSYIRSFSSDTLANYIEFYLKTMAISVDVDVNQINRISTARNTIVHDNLKTSSILPYVVPKESEEIKASDLKNGSLYLKKLLSEIADAVNDKYYKYTLEKVCRSIWDEIFFTPILRFDNVWVINGDSIYVRNYEKLRKKYAGLSGAEKLLFSIFMQQYSGSINDQIFKFNDLPAIYSLDTNSREKMINILEVFLTHPYLFNGEKY